MGLHEVTLGTTNDCPFLLGHWAIHFLWDQFWLALRRQEWHHFNSAVTGDLRGAAPSPQVPQVGRSRGTLYGYDSSTTRAPFAYGPLVEKSVLKPETTALPSALPSPWRFFKQLGDAGAYCELFPVKQW